jgi:hypothetical protein
VIVEGNEIVLFNNEQSLKHDVPKEVIVAGIVIVGKLVQEEKHSFGRLVKILADKVTNDKELQYEKTLLPKLVTPGILIIILNPEPLKHPCPKVLTFDEKGKLGIFKQPLKQ